VTSAAILVQRFVKMHDSLVTDNVRTVTRFFAIFQRFSESLSRGNSKYYCNEIHKESQVNSIQRKYFIFIWRCLGFTSTALEILKRRNLWDSQPK
jgi:hypothetical protein